MSTYLSISPHILAQFVLVGFSWNLLLVTFVKVFQETLNFVKIRQKYQAFYIKTWIGFIVADDVKSA